MKRTISKLFKYRVKPLSKLDAQFLLTSQYLIGCLYSKRVKIRNSYCVKNDKLKKSFIEMFRIHLCWYNSLSQNPGSKLLKQYSKQSLRFGEDIVVGDSLRVKIYDCTDVIGYIKKNDAFCARKNCILFSIWVKKEKDMVCACEKIQIKMVFIGGKSSICKGMVSSVCHHC